MPTFLRISEVLFCSVAGFLPYLLLLLYPFRNHLRLKNFLAGILTVAVALVWIHGDLAASLGTASHSRLLSCILLLALPVLAVRMPIHKVLLNSCSVINLQILIHAAAGAFAPAYTLRYFLITTVLQAVLLIPYAVNLVKCFGPTLCISDAPVWKLLWIVPAGGTALGLVMQWLDFASTLLAGFMAFVIILSAAVAAVMLHSTKTEMITLILRKEKPAKAAPAVQTVDPVQVHYTHLLTRLADAEHNNQALLLQVMSMEDDLAQENYEQVLNRLNFLRKQLSVTCDPTGNSRLDQVLTYFIRQGMTGGIKIVSSITVPELSAVSDEHMAVMIACLMDNALDACRQQTGGTRRIAAATQISDDMIRIGVKNTYTEAIDSDNEYLNICRTIAQLYGGDVRITEGDGVVQTVVTLNI